MSVLSMRLMLCLIILSGSILLLYDLDRYDIWSDEVFSFPRGESVGQILSLSKQTAGFMHPPGCIVLNFIWTRYFAHYKLTLNRLLFAIFGIFNLLLIFILSRALFSDKTALLTTLIFATHPFAIQYTRMIRYYPVTLFFVLLTIFFFYRLLQEKSRRNWLFFVGSSILLIYTDYLGLLVLIVLLLYLVTRPALLRKYALVIAATFAVVSMAFLPWVPTILEQMGQNVHITHDYSELTHEEHPVHFSKAQSLRHFLVNIIKRTGFLAYVFTVGETTYYWSWLIVAAIFIAYISLTSKWIRELRKANNQNLRFISFIFVVITVTCLVLSEVSGIASVTTFLFPSKVLFLLPLFLLLMGFSLAAVKSRYIFTGILVLILGGNAYGLHNYFNAKQFLNPKYLVPWERILTDIETAGGPNALLITDESSINYYDLAHESGIPHSGLVGALDTIDKYREETGEFEAFLLIRYRGDTHIVLEGLQVRDQLGQRYSQVNVLQYIPLDSELAARWHHLVGGKPFSHLVEVYHYHIDEADTILPDQTDDPGLPL